MGLFSSPPFLRFVVVPNWNIPNSPNVSPTQRALTAPHASFSPDTDARRCFQGCSGIPALLPQLWSLVVSGLTLTSSGVGNSGILPPNSGVFPPPGRNPHDCYLISASKWGRFCPGHSFYCFPPPHLHPNTNAWLPFLCSNGRFGFNQNTPGWDGHRIPGAPKQWQNFPLAEGGELRFPSEHEEMVLSGLKVGSEHDITSRIKYINSPCWQGSCGLLNTTNMQLQPPRELHESPQGFWVCYEVCEVSKTCSQTTITPAARSQSFQQEG